MTKKWAEFDWLTLTWAALVPAYSIFVALSPASAWSGKLAYVAGSVAWALLIAYLIKRKQGHDRAEQAVRTTETQANIGEHQRTQEGQREIKGEIAALRGQLETAYRMDLQRAGVPSATTTNIATKLASTEYFSRYGKLVAPPDITKDRVAQLLAETAILHAERQRRRDLIPPQASEHSSDHS